MMPLYLEPAVGFSSTVALRLWIEPAVELNSSSNSSRVASLTTGFWAGGVFLTTLTWPPHPAKMSAIVPNETRSILPRVVWVPGWDFAGTRFNWGVQCARQKAEVRGAHGESLRWATIFR